MVNKSHAYLATYVVLMFNVLMLSVMLPTHAEPPRGELSGRAASVRPLLAEDDPAFNCHLDGNRICGPVDTNPYTNTNTNPPEVHNDNC